MPFEIDGKFVNKTLLWYVPHGISDKTFKPLIKNDMMLSKRKKDIFGENRNYDFIILFNSRNVQRKRVSNIILAYKTFCDNISKAEAEKCLLILHTETVCDAGTDLLAVKEAFCPEYNIMFSTNKCSPEDMNILYNISDVTINASSSEGFGLSTAESIMAGTPIIVAVTGGLQDQIGQVKDDGSPIEFGLHFGTNNIGKYRKHGIWAYPVWTEAMCVQGSPQTPFIMDDVTSFKKFADGMMYWYRMKPEDREKCGAEGRRWAMNEGGINANNMCKEFIDCVNYTLDHFRPVKTFGIFTEKDYIGNIMPGGMGLEIPVIDKEKIDQEITETVNNIIISKK